MISGNRARVQTSNFPPPQQVSHVANHAIEARMAMFVALHTPLNVSMHMVRCNQTCSRDFAGVTLGRTKCRALVVNALSPYVKNRLIQDVGESPFSLYLDESTDVATKKYLGISYKQMCLNIRT